MSLITQAAREMFMVREEGIYVPFHRIATEHIQLEQNLLYKSTNMAHNLLACCISEEVKES